MGGDRSATVGGLTNGTAYTFTVTATNAVGRGPASSPSNSVTPKTGSATVPGAPTTVTATAGDASATVSWTAPSDGGSAITGYTVTSAPGNITASAGASARSATVSGLANGTSYTFTVTATNAVGRGPASSPSNSVTPKTGSATVPGAPTNVTATAGDASAIVKWTAPTSDGGSAITGYTATSAPGNITASAGASARSATVSGLTNGTAFTFTVTATNAVGTGASSSPVTPQAATLTTVQETAPAVSYNSWAGVTDAASSGGSYRISEAANATVTVTTHTIVIKVLGTKRTSATEANVTVDGFLVGATTTPVQENSPTVTFDSWTGVVNASADGGSYRASATAGATATFTFSGTRVDWITARAPGYGMALVSIDGGAAVTVDLYSATWQWRVVGWSFGGLSAGSHTLTTKVLGVKNAASSGIKVLVDALAIVSTASANLAAAADSGESATAVPYAGEGRTADPIDLR